MNIYLKDLQKVLAITNYKGCCIMQKNSGFYVFGKKHNSLEEARQTIDNSFKNLEKTIK